MSRVAWVLVIVLAGRTESAAQDTGEDPQWQLGGFADIGYLFEPTDSSNTVFRSRGTTWHLNAPQLNMAGAYVSKKAGEKARWGAELLVHSGKDDELFAYSATAPSFGAGWLRHVGAANLSYLAPMGRGLTVQGGIFSSLIGYDSLYAKNNFNYTRPWGADFTPYLMLGVNANYPLTDKLTGTFYVVNGYWHLAKANRVPSSGVQLAYQATPQVTIKETVLAGPHQSNTSLEFWRYLADTIIEHRTNRVVGALNFHFSTERVDAGAPFRAWWVAAQLPIRWIVHGPWSVAVRPELAWDSDRRWTSAEQTVAALTTTVEHRAKYRDAGMLIRLEYRLDVSRGPDGGFYSGGMTSGQLKPSQHLVIFGLIVAIDSNWRPEDD